jgi:crossover junction endodeoxyribonuclease RusA
MMPRGGKKAQRCRVCKRADMVMIEAADKALRPYRQALQLAAMETKGTDWSPILGGVKLEILFRYVRPVSHLKKNGGLRKGKPLYKISKPDLDKLERSAGDALTAAKIWKDDSQIVLVVKSKNYTSNPEDAGVHIMVTEL